MVVDTFVAPRRPLPCWHRQVNERWLDEYRGWVYGAAFGLQLGMGVVTIITSATAYAVVIAVGSQPTLGASVGVGATFGTARGLMVLAVRHVKAPGQLAAFHRRFAAAAVTAGRVASGAAAIVGLVGLGLAVGST